MGLAYKSSETCRTVGSYKHTQAPDQEALDLHNITTAELKLVEAYRAVVDHCYTRTCH